MWKRENMREMKARGTKRGIKERVNVRNESRVGKRETKKGKYERN